MDENEQRFLRRLWKIGRNFDKGIAYTMIAFYNLLIILAIIFTIQDMERYALACISILSALTLALLIVLLIGFCIKQYFKKDESFDPCDIQIPNPETVNIEASLHHMSHCVGCVMIRTVVGCILLFLISSLLLFPKGNKVMILSSILVIFILGVLCDRYFKARWKKRNFTKKLYKFTKKYVDDQNMSDWIRGLEDDFQHDILYYAKEFIITKNYFLGNICSEMVLQPVVVKCDQIKNITFHRILGVGSKRRLYQGYLMCELQSGVTVPYFIGQYPIYIPTLRTLKYNGIKFLDGEDLYS